MTEAPPSAPVEPTTPEPVTKPEKELFAPHFRALHGRILLGNDNLDPENKNIPDATKESLINGSAQVLNECATNCRRRVALVEKDNLDNEITSRVEQNTKVLKQDLSKIRGFDGEKASRWHTTLTKLLGKDTSSAGEQDVKALFDKYFYSKDRLGNASDTDLFAEDVLKAFNNDLSEIEKNIDCINWYARVCGFTKDFSEIVFKHQITAKTLLKTNPDQLVDELNKKAGEGQSSRINKPNTDEDEVLRFIWGSRGKTVVVDDFSEQSTEQKQSPLNPWEIIPKPSQPIIIQQGEVGTDAQGNRFENSEVKLLLGTADYPLVTENKWSDGRVEKVRRIEPERSYHIPSIIYFDDDLNEEQRTVILDSLSDIFDQIGVPNNMIFFSQESGSKFIAGARQRPNGQVDTDHILSFMRTDETQLERPHHAVTFTNKDLYSGDTNFVVGSAIPDLGTIISLKRVWQGIVDPPLRNNVIKTETAHEIGHVYNLPSSRRGKKNIEQSLGAHCKNDGCCMKQGLNVPADFISITQNRLRFLGEEKYFCPDCQQDLQEKFTKD